ncbi:S9 family peptidase [Pseudoalteromonas sp. T1lg65]|uniref:S9 family peptidase n=1 Tax=Pseudoalteromonas sp. T1lg65 TaxID=2077101 RepID=UPI003F7B2B72
MRNLSITIVAAAVAALVGCQQTASSSSAVNKRDVLIADETISAPIAKKVPHITKIHGYELVDNYHWLRDDTRSDEKILSHLEQENAYTTAKLKATESLQQQLFEEIKGRIVKDDASVPVKKGNYYYFYKTQGEQEYPVYYRSKDANGENAEVLYDENELSKGHGYYAIDSYAVSPNDQLLAYAQDPTGRRIYTVRIKDLNNGQYFEDSLEGVSANIVWANDNQTLYYIKKDPVSLLGYQVYRHKIGTAQSEDQLVYEETDNTFYTGLGKSKDGSLIYIHHSSYVSRGVSVLDANDTSATPERLLPRTQGLEYSVEKLEDWFYIWTNKDAVNFKLMRAKVNDIADVNKWQTVVPHNPDVKLDDFELFAEHLVYETREQGLPHLTVLNLSTNKSKRIAFNDPTYTLGMRGNYDITAGKLRLVYSSMTTPSSVYDVDLKSLEKTLLKQSKVLGDFTPDNYKSERLFITARDGAKIPVSLVYRKDKFKQDGTNPLLQYGYGSYGINVSPKFSISNLSLLDRGFVYAIAHIRGSETLGRPWYDDGKMLNKKNTFNDFIDVTKALADKKYGDPSRIYARGGSAGGLLMGAVINQAPELYDGVHAAVPFVDVINTMLDESLPLTTNEYDEWGNPNDKTYFDYMYSYSPYDQVKAQAYPNLLVTTGLHDSQVQYFEPAKWVAKLRDHKTDDNLLLFKTNMEAGHGGSAGRFQSIHETALSYSFFIGLANNQL